MALGRVYPGRLPSTQANIDLMRQRIKIVKSQQRTLDMQVRNGQIDSRDAAYRRKALTGEIADLKNSIRRVRLSTPSYKVPRDLQMYRARKPRNKMMPESTTDDKPSGYFGDDRRTNGSSIPSEWTATTLTEFDVPDVKGQPGWHRGNWPAHWPGSHSPSINRAVMQAGEVNGRQVIDPRDPNMQLRLNLAQNPQHMAMALQVKAMYEQLYEITVANPIFTPTDQTLVNIIIGKINRQIEAAEAEMKRMAIVRPSPSTGLEEAKQTKIEKPKVDADVQRPEDVRFKLPSKLVPPGMSLPGGSPSLNRRRGTIMGIGAMQAHDRNRHLMNSVGKPMTVGQRASYLAAQREMTLSRARAGARVDVTQQLKETPVTRPWSIQVSLPGDRVQMLNNMIDINLAQVGLSQVMFTQQAHDYVASVINSMDSSMQPTQQTELVIEHIMSELVNRSALLNKNVKVDINQSEGPPVNFSEVSGLSGGFLKTKAALGRLLG